MPVEVYNNSGVTGLAGRVATTASRIGWQVVGSDNWYGTVDATTVYYPKRLEAAAKQLALDLGIRRTAPAVDPMRLDRLTVILDRTPRLARASPLHLGLLAIAHRQGEGRDRRARCEHSDRLTFAPGLRGGS